MRNFKLLALAAIAGLCFTAAPAAQAQIRVGIGINTAPSCPYGYYDYAPYNCTPYGYYGPEWYTNGVFIGAGPWHHGHDHFYGHSYYHVDNRFDPRHGYNGGYPQRGEVRAEHHEEFHGNARSDGRGHYRR